MKEKLVNGVSEAIEGMLGRGYDVQFYEIVKGSGCVTPSVVIREPGTKMCPAIHVGRYLAGMETGEMLLQDAVQAVVGLYIKIRDISLQADMITSPDRHEIFDKVRYQLVCTEKYASKLSCMPHKELPGISAVYRVDVKEDGDKTASIIVDYAICEKAGLSEEELDVAADMNTQLHGFHVQTFASVFPGIADGMGIDPGSLWLFTAWPGYDGAVVIFYPYYLGKLANRLGKDLYVALSGGYGAVVTPARNGVSPDALANIIRRVNAARNMADDPIGGKVYRYRHKKKTVEIAWERADSIL